MTVAQKAIGAICSAAFAGALVFATEATLGALYVSSQTLFWMVVGWRTLLLASAPPRGEPPPEPHRPDLPCYTVVVALHREAKVAGQLVRSLKAIDYPRDRFEVLFAVEASDDETAAALIAARPPRWMRVVRVPPGGPQTKPRALNHALRLATGEFLVIYDAEDAPDPLQLREAARRFAEEDDQLVCLQAPLRIRGAERGFISRQFAAEYAALFEIMLPAMARLGLPFPLGGTSNHFRVSALRAIGGWDPFNVTEDADLGFRMAGWGWRTGVLRRPTTESAPPTLQVWLPQRARWIKGYLQTWSVHMRRPFTLRLEAATALHMTIGVAIASGLAHGPVLAVLAAQVLLHAADGSLPIFRTGDALLLGTGWVLAVSTCLAGSTRVGRSYRWSDAVLAPAYWALLSLASLHALWRWWREPHHWDKTEHLPDLVFAPEPAGRLAA